MEKASDDTMRQFNMGKGKYIYIYINKFFTIMVYLIQYGQRDFYCVFFLVSEGVRACARPMRACVRACARPVRACVRVRLKKDSLR